MKKNIKNTEQANIYANSHRLWTRDLRRCFEYVNPDDRNLEVYSHRFFELQLRACTEFESIAKSLLYDLSLSRKKQPNIKDFSNLSIPLDLQNCSLSLQLWLPVPKLLKPFDGWVSSDSTLSWYQAYNKVKHNRVEHFASASLGNTIMAGAGVFILLAQGYKSDILEKTSSTSYGRTETTRYRFKDFPYIFEKPTNLFAELRKMGN
ncbi:MAG: hypothetical protein FVQ82_15980 [Planctomycetes bacterium]|nr:hypothetical protein [Planctomycetota bacterium]